MKAQGAFNLLFRPGLRKDFHDEFEQWEPEYPDFLKVGTTATGEEAASIMTGLNRLYERGDGEPIIYEDPKIGPKVMGVSKEFAGGFMITRRTVEKDLYNKANQGAKWLAHAARLTKEYRAAAVLDDAFTGNIYRTIDNLPLIHTAHTLINSSLTVSNRLAADVAVSVAGITAMFDLWSIMKDENGDPIKAFPDELILGNSPGDFNTALQIWNSSLEPFTSDNTDNVIRRRLAKPKMLVSHYKIAPKSWFMVSSRLNDAHLLVERAIEFDDTFDFDTDIAKYKATEVFMIWVVTWRGWTGSNPT